MSHQLERGNPIRRTWLASKAATHPHPTERRRSTASAHLGRWREADVAIVHRADPETRQREGGSGSDVTRPRSAVMASVFAQKGGEWQHLIA
jgi:hypothetical protein